MRFAGFYQIVALIFISFFLFNCISPTDDEAIAAYKKFADEHYSHERLIEWYKYVNDSTVLNVVMRSTAHEPFYFSEQPNKTDDYYEMIAKYDVFAQGWDDVTPLLTAQYYDKQNTPAVMLKLQDTAKYWTAFALDTLTPYLTDKNGNIESAKFLHYRSESIPYYYGKSNNQIYYMGLRQQAN